MCIALLGLNCIWVLLTNSYDQANDRRGTPSIHLGREEHVQVDLYGVDNFVCNGTNLGTKAALVTTQRSCPGSVHQGAHLCSQSSAETRVYLFIGKRIVTHILIFYVKKQGLPFALFLAFGKKKCVWKLTARNC